ncbi:hypothetical protein LCGC14_1254160 [marine sediment metagenome]|uniref:LamG-like jellyroll fold domain-containing protein n=1 Tax=marine sediment metagenome TaxID=412755 RepID=A0A0F9P629_9ZZZZ
MRNRALEHTYARANWGLKFRPDANTVLWLPGQDDNYSSTIRDRSGQGNDGTITGATWAQTGQGLWYLKFTEDAGDNVNCGADSSLDLGSSWTIFMWFFSSDTASETGGLMSKDDGTTNRDFFITIRNASPAGVLQLAHRISDVEKLFISGITVDDGNWHLAFFMNDGTDLIIDNDGTVETDAGKGGATDNEGADLLLGRWRVSEELDGGIALARIVNNKVLSVDERTSIRNQERHLFGV